MGNSCRDDKEKPEIIVEDIQPVSKTTDVVPVQTYLAGAKLCVTMASVFSIMFVVSLDRHVLTPAVARISDEFHSVNHIGWYGSVYLLTWSGFALQYGKVYALYNAKVAYIVAIVLFELGSVVCATARNSPSLIFGRAVCGIGSAGLGSGSIVLMVHSLPLHRRALYFSLSSSAVALASILGPLIGGALTTHATWRFCFWINVPPGALVILVIWIWVAVPQQRRHCSDSEDAKSLLERCRELDIPGLLAIVPGMTCLTLVMEMGGTQFPWTDGRAIGLIMAAAVFLTIFILIQYCFPDTSIIPSRIILQRSVFWAAFASFSIGASQSVFMYYLTIWFQVIDRLNALEAGVRILPLLVAMIAGMLLSGVLVRVIGYYMVPMYIGVPFMAVGAGFLTTLTQETSLAARIGFQVLYGWGMGCVCSAPNLATQAVLSLADVPIGTASMFFFQCLGGAIAIPIGQNVMIGQLAKRLAGKLTFEPALLQSNGVTTIIDQFTGTDVDIVRQAYNSSLADVFVVGLVITCLLVPCAMRMECKSTKKAKAEEARAGETEAKESKTKEITPQESTTACAESQDVDIEQMPEKLHRVHAPEFGPSFEDIGKGP